MTSVTRQARILWELGGKQNQFSLPSDLITGPYGSAFQFQHDARFVPGGISLLRRRRPCARRLTAAPMARRAGLILNVDVQNHTASLARPAYLPQPGALCEQPG